MAVVKSTLRSLGSRIDKEEFILRAIRRADRQGTSIQEAEEDATLFWETLVSEKLLIPHPDYPESYYQTSEQALAIANAKIGPGHTDKAAAKALAGFVERAKALDDPASIYPFRVGLAILFGSHAAGKPLVGDVDLWVRLLPRHADPKEQDQAVNRFIDAMVDEGYSVPGGIASIFWPHQQAMRFLKNRSHILSFVSDDDRHLKLAITGPFRAVHPPEAQAWVDEARREAQQAVPVVA